jgi:hypothetical protein
MFNGTGKMKTTDKKRLIVHIGLPKTGTTSLQRFFAVNDQKLEELGVTYPNLINEGFGWAALRGMGSGNAFIKSPDFEWESNNLVSRSEWLINESLCKQIATQTILLSSEILSFVASKIEFWSALSAIQIRHNCEIEVVAYLRDPFRSLVAEYQQIVKLSGFSGNFDDFIMKIMTEDFGISFIHQQAIGNIVSMAKNAGIDLKLFRYEDSLPSIEKHFILNVLQIDLDGLNYESVLANPSLSPSEIEFHRGVNSVSEKLGKMLGYERIDWSLSQHMTKIRISEDVFFISEENQARLTQSFSTYRDALQNVTDFADKIDYSIDQNLVTAEPVQSLVDFRNQVYELGRFVGLSYESGYIDWDRKVNEPK